MTTPPRYISRRSPVYAPHAMVASSQPLATFVGLRIMREMRGNAADAAVGVAAMLSLLEPNSTGPGGDVFAMFYNAKTKTVEGINGSGRSGANLNAEEVARRFAKEPSSTLPPHHGLCVTVPGAVRAWEDVLKRWGRLSLAEVLAPAVEYARGGVSIEPITAHYWNEIAASLTPKDHAVNPLYPPPRPGERYVNRDLAEVFETIAREGSDGFYSPNSYVCREICKAVKAHGGCLEPEDLERHRSEFVVPIKTRYEGRVGSADVWEIPPNNQGIVLLFALDTLQDVMKKNKKRGIKQQRLGDTTASDVERRSTEHYHLLIECLRSSFCEARKMVADPSVVPKHSGPEAVERALRDPARRERRVNRVDLTKATIYDEVEEADPLPSSETVSFQVVDEEGNAISFVNSNYEGFGTGIVPARCGFSLQNRGMNFSLDLSNSPNALAPSKRPYHTIIPTMMTVPETGDFYASLTNMGGFMQPQGTLQLITNLLDWGDDVQTAVDEPRFCLRGTEVGAPRTGADVALEEGVPEHVARELVERMGHARGEVLRGYRRSLFGRAQIVLDLGARGDAAGEEEERKRRRMLVGGSDGRCDGCCMGY